MYRCLLVVSLSLLFSPGLWALPRVAPRITTEETKAAQKTGGPLKKAVITPDMSEEERQAVLQRLKEERQARTAAMKEEGRRRGLQWDGCKFNTIAKKGDKAFAEQKKVADDLFAVQLIPAERMGHFKWVPSDRYVIVGWSATVMSVSQTKQGRSVELQVRPTLATTGGHRAVFTPFCLREVWTLQNGKKPTCQSCKPDEGEYRPDPSSPARLRLSDAKMIFVD